MNIYLVRHGESLQNKYTEFCTIPDELIPLTEKGKKQAHDVGVFLASELNNLNNSTIVCSTYVRAKQTARLLNDSLGLDVSYDKRLREFKRGVFGKYSFEECAVRFPKEFEEFKQALAGKNKFYAKAPQGESAEDVANRIKPFKAYMDELEQKGIENLVIVSHSGAIRSFLCAVMGYDKDWYAVEKNMVNCSVRHLEKSGENYVDNGYIYGGYKHKSRAELSRQQNQDGPEQNL
ncbi:MAG: histidine phosphatase family protein [Clostridia bacterium]|nr:histidine phosphatase family protein [Clostridia bacterium]